jgi:hypothetical protein
MGHDQPDVSELLSSEHIRDRVEEILARQPALSPQVRRLVREKLQQWDWEAFTSRVLEKYYAAVEKAGEAQSAEEYNKLLMELVQSEVAIEFQRTMSD